MVAPAGTVAVIKEALITVNVAAVPLNVTALAPFRSVPRILTSAPTLPTVGCVSTNGARPTDRLKTVPRFLGPALDCCAIEAAVGALDQPRERGGAVSAVKAVECRQPAAGGDTEDGANGAALPGSCPIEVSVGALNETAKWRGAARAIAFRAKAVERSQRAAGRHFEDRAIALGPAAPGRCPIEIPISSLDQPGDRIGAVRTTFFLAKGVKRRQCAVWSHCEDCASPVTAPLRGSIEIPIVGLDESPDGVSVQAIKAVQRRQRAAWSDLENCAIIVGAAIHGRSIEIPIGGLDQSRVRVSAVDTAAFRAKPVKRRQGASWSNFEDCAVVLALGSPRGRPIKVPICCLDQPRRWEGAVRAEAFGAKAVERGQLAAGCDSENRAIAFSPARQRCPVKVPIGALDENPPRCGAVRIGKAVKGD